MLRTAGAVSALLLGLLAAGEIDGALVSKPSADPEEQWKGMATIATTAEQIRGAAGSFYNQTMALAELDLSRYALPDQVRASPSSGPPVRSRGCGPCRRVAGPPGLTVWMPWS